MKTIIIFGAGNYGKEILDKYIQDKDKVLFYDNDRRKWGSKINSIEVINLNKFIELVDRNDTELIIGCKFLSGLHFLKDINPVCKVLKESENGLEIFDINEIQEFKYDNSIEKGTENLKNYLIRAEELKKTKKIEEYEHAIKYIDYKEKHIELPEISSIEFTNNCNLKCPNCPNSTLKFPKGFISEEVFEEALKYIPPYKTDTVAVHCMGEPLLHPKCMQYLQRLAKIGVNICLSTNGLLLEDEKSEELLNIFTKLDKSILYVSFHTKKSVENWMKFLEKYKTYPNNNMIFRGQVLEHNEKEALKWLKEIGINNPKEHPYIRFITSHSFAGNVPGRKTEYSDVEVRNRIRNCYYLRQRKIAVMWDGTIRGCCYDSNAEQKCGSIFEFEKTKLNPNGYELCKYCDPDWITNWQ